MQNINRKLTHVYIKSVSILLQSLYVFKYRTQIQRLSFNPPSLFGNTSEKKTIGLNSHLNTIVHTQTFRALNYDSF